MDPCCQQTADIGLQDCCNSGHSKVSVGADAVREWLPTWPSLGCHMCEARGHLARWGPQAVAEDRNPCFALINAFLRLMCPGLSSIQQCALPFFGCPGSGSLPADAI